LTFYKSINQSINATARTSVTCALNRFCHVHECRGATTFSTLGVQFLGLYVQSKMRMVYPVSWTAVCYVTVITLFIKKLGWSVQIFWGSGAPDPSSGFALAVTGRPTLLQETESGMGLAGNFHVHTVLIYRPISLARSWPLLLSLCPVPYGTAT